MTEPRDPAYSKPPRWAKLYDKHCPEHTCPASRHAVDIAQGLRNVRGDLRARLDGLQPDHKAESIEATVIALWEARAEIERLQGELAVAQA